MCYQLIELYSLCQCPYIEHAVDRCSCYGRPGHEVIQRTILVGTACSTHTEECLANTGASLPDEFWLEGPEPAQASFVSFDQNSAWSSNAPLQSLESSCTSLGSDGASYGKFRPMGSSFLPSIDSPGPIGHTFHTNIALSAGSRSLSEVLRGFQSMEGTDTFPSNSNLHAATTKPQSVSENISIPSRNNHSKSLNRQRDTAIPLSPEESKQRDPQSPSKSFACPFWKKSPRAYQSCYHLILRRTRDVKQHLHRRHSPAYYCERCLRVLNDEMAHRAHVSGAVACERAPGIVLDGLSHAQTRALSRKAQRGAEAAESWFAIWDVVFPGCARPCSPYVDAGVPADLCAFREYCLEEGGRALWRRLEDEGLWSMAAEERCVRGKQVFMEGLEALYEDWVVDHGLQFRAPGKGSVSASPVTMRSRVEELGGRRGLVSNDTKEEYGLVTSCFQRSDVNCNAGGEVDISMSGMEQASGQNLEVFDAATTTEDIHQQGISWKTALPTKFDNGQPSWY